MFSSQKSINRIDVSAFEWLLGYIYINKSLLPRSFVHGSLALGLPSVPVSILYS